MVLNLKNEQLSLLITDDDEECRNSLKYLFDSEGYTTHIAGCGRDAIEVAREVLLHFMIIDAHLPDISGIETFEYIKEESQVLVPCIFMSGDVSKELKLEILSVEAFTFVPKPLNVGTVKFAVNQLIDQYY